MNSAIIPDIVILFGGIFSFILSAGQLALQKKSINNILLSLLFFFIGVFQVSNGFTLFAGFDMWFQIYHILFPIGIISFFFIGPLQYLYFKTVVNNEITISKYFPLHFIPGIIFGLLLFLQTVNNSENSIPVHQYRTYIIENYFIYKITALISVLFFITYCLLLLKYLITLHLQKHTERKKILRITIYFITVLLSIVLLWPLHILFSIQLLKLIHVLLTIYIVTIYILSNRYPQYIHIIKLEAQRDTYIRSQTKGLDIEKILKKLSRIMEEEKLFCYEDLTIQLLATELDITSHQLSEILNLNIGKSFYNYINERRIEEAKGMLREDPNRNILSIAHEVGYNSTSAFYNAFKKYTGFSPSAYRKNNSR